MSHDSTYEIQINSIDYSVSIVQNDRKLVIELSDIYSADSWRGTFEAHCKFIK